MFNNQNYPWYVQQAPSFKVLYDGFYTVANYATPLGIGSMFDSQALQGTGLFQLGMAWGLTGSPTFFDGLIYDVDNWSDLKVWSGQPQDVNKQIYRNFIKMKAYIYGKNYSLTVMKEALAILLSGFQYIATVTEGYMSFTINISANADVLRILQEMQSYDQRFLGHLPGIKILFNYVVTE